MFKFLLKLIILLSACTLAMAGQDLGLGKVAENLMDPISVFAEFIDTACIIIGGSFIFASVVKYFEYRRSPLMVSLGTVFFLLFAGIILLFLPLLTFVSNTSITLSK